MVSVCDQESGEAARGLYDGVADQADSPTSPETGALEVDRIAGPLPLPPTSAVFSKLDPLMMEKSPPSRLPSISCSSS